MKMVENNVKPIFINFTPPTKIDNGSSSIYNGAVTQQTPVSTDMPEENFTMQNNIAYEIPATQFKLCSFT